MIVCYQSYSIATEICLILWRSRYISQRSNQPNSFNRLLSLLFNYKQNDIILQQSRISCSGAEIRVFFLFSDSLYFGCAGSTLDEAVCPEMKFAYTQALYHSCYKNPDGTPDTSIQISLDNHFWFPRRCCSTHFNLDK